MTTPDSADARPVPDADDLRLLAEIINNGSIGLPQAAWNARMSQAEAAARFVTMAERGLPLRLAAEGDRQLLWRIAQAGPATSGVPIAPAAVPVSAPVPVVAPVPLPVEPPPVESQPVQQIPVAPMAPPTAPAPDVLPPASAVPPHEQAIAGAVPLGQPPFGTPPVEPEPEPEWVPEAAAPEPEPAAPEPEPEPPAPGPDPTRRMLISGQWTQSITGLFGEHLDVTLQQIIDPADQILTANGRSIEPGQRALLVQTTLGNRGPIDYEALPDLYLVIQDSAGTILQKAPTTVDGYPAHHAGVAAATLVSGWTVFLVPAGTEVAQVHWSVRPDMPNRTLSWGFGPA